MTDNWGTWKKESCHLKQGFKVPGKAGPQTATVKEALLCLGERPGWLMAQARIW